MKALYLWPEHAALSLFVLWAASVVFLWAAREPMLGLLRSLGEFVADGCAGLARACDSAAAGLRTPCAQSCMVVTPALIASAAANSTLV